MPDDFFRIRLVCVLLDTCGMCFDRGSQQKKLDNFLTFFQLYVHCKSALPMDVEYMLSDSLEVRCVMYCVVGDANGGDMRGVGGEVEAGAVQELRGGGCGGG